MMAELQMTNSTRISHIMNVTLDDTGIYFCCFRSLTSITNIYVVKLVKLANATVPTEITEEEIDSKILIRRTLWAPSTSVDGIDPNDQFMVCICKFAPSVQLERVLVSWKGGLVNNLDNASVYERFTWRHSRTNEIGSKLGLSTPSLDQGAYGKYRCVFELAGSGSIGWDVFLRVPPILRLSSDPPPPPLSAAVLHDPTCKNSTNPRNVLLRTQWEQACLVVVAFPPVRSSKFYWNWSHPEHALRLVDSKTRPTGGGSQQSAQPPEAEEKVDCAGLIIKQRQDKPMDGSVIFWCHAENEVGGSEVWWPTADGADTLFNSILWPVVAVLLQVICVIAVIIWDRFFCRNRQKTGLHLPGTFRSTAGDADVTNLLGNGDAGGSGSRCQGANKSPIAGLTNMDAIELTRKLMARPSEYAKLESQKLTTLQERLEPTAVSPEIYDGVWRLRNYADDDPYFWDEGTTNKNVSSVI
ncbi:hypothetical protein AAHC03_01241 [Spirometra sp. Aus1]